MGINESEHAWLLEVISDLKFYAQEHDLRIAADALHEVFFTVQISLATRYNSTDQATISNPPKTLDEGKVVFLVPPLKRGLI